MIFDDQNYNNKHTFQHVSTMTYDSFANTSSTILTKIDYSSYNAWIKAFTRKTAYSSEGKYKVGR